MKRGWYACLKSCKQAAQLSDTAAVVHVATRTPTTYVTKVKVGGVIINLPRAIAWESCLPASDTMNSTMDPYLTKPAPACSHFMADHNPSAEKSGVVPRVWISSSRFMLLSKELMISLPVWNTKAEIRMITNRRAPTTLPLRKRLSPRSGSTRSTNTTYAMVLIMQLNTVEKYFITRPESQRSATMPTTNKARCRDQGSIPPRQGAEGDPSPCT
mmetsp:Transcript_70220/g.195434  ORF Transcript_70220/g.195434 Transcript_70220/m.195434 type:complete len:214 (+) Transcript_70220:1034-1675(+)